MQTQLFPSPPETGPIGAIESWARAQNLLPLMGVDEAGRGPLAGPVIAAAVVLPTQQSATLDRLNDSKVLSPSVRQMLYGAIESSADALGVGYASVDEIDAVNILEATRLAMHRAIDECRAQNGGPPACLLVDGNLPLPNYSGQQWALVKGDSRSLSVAAASIIAKVTRDRLMVKLESQYPGYGFAQHKGYGTRAHRAALTQLGPCPAHRKSFSWKPYHVKSE